MSKDLNARTIELSQLKGTVRFHEGVAEYHQQMFEHFAQILAERIKEEHSSKQPKTGKASATPSKIDVKKVNGVERQERKGKLSIHRDDLKEINR